MRQQKTKQLKLLAVWALALTALSLQGCSTKSDEDIYIEKEDAICEKSMQERVGLMKATIMFPEDY